jgi:hypothetical protein
MRRCVKEFQFRFGVKYMNNTRRRPYDVGDSIRSLFFRLFA